MVESWNASQTKFSELLASTQDALAGVAEQVETMVALAETSCGVTSLCSIHSRECGVVQKTRHRAYRAKVSVRPISTSWTTDVLVHGSTISNPAPVGALSRVLA